MQQAFTRDRLEAYTAAMHTAIARGLESWQPGDGFQAYWALKDLTLGIATETFMGGAEHTSPQEMARVNRAFIACVQAAAAIVRRDVPFTRWHRGMKGRKVLEEFVRGYLPSRRATATDDLLSVLCHIESDEGERFSDEDVVNHMIFLMMAAHDTSTIALSMLTYFLGRHPEWQQRLREESLALNKPTIDYDDVDKLPSMELAFKETLRLNAPVGMLFRMAIEDTEICGHYIPKGTLLAIHPWATMLRKEWWPNPTHFDPERFSAERREDKVHRFAWAPFGGGAHKCIGLYFGGMEVKSILHQMLQRFEWTVPAGYKPELTYGTGPTPADGLPIDIRHRAL